MSKENLNAVVIIIENDCDELAIRINEHFDEGFFLEGPMQIIMTHSYVTESGSGEYYHQYIQMMIKDLNKK